MKTRILISNLKELRGETLLDEDNAHIIRDVLRLKKGDRIELLDGRELVADAEVVEVQRKRVSVGLLSTIQAEAPKLRIGLLQGLPKGDRASWIVEKAVEWGVDQIHMVKTEFSVPDRSKNQLGRWQRVAREALRQSGNPFLPAIEGPHPLAQVLQGLSSWDSRILLDEKEKCRTLRSILGQGSAKSVLLAVGPEGGWSSAERENLVRAGFSPALLAPYTLRTETAAISAVAAVYAILGSERK